MITSYLRQTYSELVKLASCLAMFLKEYLEKAKKTNIKDKTQCTDVPEG